MSKPSWDEAPEWANWLSTDYMGATFFEDEPRFDRIDGMWFDGIFYALTGRQCNASKDRFENSLERRA